MADYSQYVLQGLNTGAGLASQAQQMAFRKKMMEEERAIDEQRMRQQMALAQQRMGLERERFDYDKAQQFNAMRMQYAMQGATPADQAKLYEVFPTYFLQQQEAQAKAKMAQQALTNAEVTIGGKNAKAKMSGADALTLLRNPNTAPVIQGLMSQGQEEEQPQGLQVPSIMPDISGVQTSSMAQRQLEEEKARLAEEKALRDREMQERRFGFDMSEAERKARIEEEKLGLDRQRLDLEGIKIKSDKGEKAGKTLTDSAVTTLGEFETGLSDLQTLQERYNSLAEKGKTGVVASKMAGLTGLAGNFFSGKGIQGDPELETYKNLVTSIVPNLARGVFGEVGVLTDKDVERYTKLLSDPSTPPQIAKQNFAQLLSKIKTGYKRKLSAYERAGYDVAGFMGESEESQATETQEAVADPLGIRK